MLMLWEQESYIDAVTTREEIMKRRSQQKETLLYTNC